MKLALALLAKRFRVIFAACIFLPLFACTTYTPPETTLVQISSATELESWRFEGKIGLKQKDKSQSAFIKWDQAKQDFRIELHGPFGKGRTIIEKSGSVSSLKDKNREITASDPNELFYKATGANMPVTRLSWWLKGVAAPNVQLDNPTLTEDGQLQSFSQGNWQVEILRFTAVDKYKLPEKIILSDNHYRLTIIIKSWKTNVEIG